MSNPPVAIHRGRGWSTAAWEEHLPHAHKVVKQATQWLGELGVSYDEPKVMTVTRVRRRTHSPFIYVGEAYDANRFQLFANADPLRDELSRQECFLLDVSETVHELFHTIRMEEPENDLNHSFGGQLETMATEGLSYSAEIDYLHRNRGAAFISRILEPYVEGPLRTDQQAFRAPVRYGHGYGYAKWISANAPEQQLGNLNYCGIVRVQAQLERGATLADLIKQPAEEVLGIA